MSTIRELWDAIADIEALPLRRAERDALCEPLMAQLDKAEAEDTARMASMMKQVRMDIEIEDVLSAAG